MELGGCSAQKELQGGVVLDACGFEHNLTRSSGLRDDLRVASEAKL